MSPDHFNELIPFYSAYFVLESLLIALSIACYIFSAIGLFSIAKRRKIESPWLAFVPVGSAFITGAIGDDYMAKVKNKKTNLRHWILYFNVALFVLICAFYPVLALGVLKAGISISENIYNPAIAFVLVIIALSILLMGIAIATAVLQWICYYRLFISCSKKDGLTFFLISLFITQALPFLIFAVRNKDEGMPIQQGE